MEEYTFVKPLGEGGFAKVISVKDKEGKVWALKKPFHEKDYLTGLPGVINMKELYIMGFVKHPYIQSARRIFFEDPCPRDNVALERKYGYERMFFLMDEAKYSCYDLVHRHRAPISHVKRAMYQIMCAVYYLHQMGICHRDLKPGNFLCHYDRGVLTAKLTDFGTTKPFNWVNKNSLHAGTSYYRPPEMLLDNDGYNKKMDVWSLGVSFFEMVSGRVMFRAVDDIQIMKMIFRDRGSPGAKSLRRIRGNGGVYYIPDSKKSTIQQLLRLPSNLRKLFDTEIVDKLYNPGSLEQFCDLLENMIEIDPGKRYNMKQVFEHPFFSGFTEPHPQHYDLYVQKPYVYEMPTPRFPRNHKTVMWALGANEFLEIQMVEKPSEEKIYSIKFHALDLYNRFLCMIKPCNPVDYIHIAWVCAYITSKYFFDEDSQTITTLCPRAIKNISLKQLIMLERTILTTLDYEIYRPTLFTMVESRKFYDALLALALTPNIVYDRPIEKIMEIFNASASERLKQVSK